MTGRQHQPPRPVHRTARAERLLFALGQIETAALNAVIELRSLDLDGLADTLNAELGHMQQVRTAANQLRIEDRR